MTKIEMGKFSIEEKPFSIQKCVANTCNILFPATKSKGLDLVCIVADNVPETLVGDQARLNQVLTNLAGNAVKFTEKGKVEIQVVAGNSRPDGKREITFTVTDTGIGIPDDKKERIFGVFSQVDESHSRCYGGTGLGLAISKEIVELMGGTISFMSEEGKGTAFSFTVPLKEAGLEPDTLSAVESLSPETITTAPEVEKIPRILLAEDDSITRNVIGLMLKRSNYNLDIAEDGQKAVEMWEKGGYDLVLMDVQMPRLNGFEATSVIREKERVHGGHTPIVAMTAHAREEDEKICLAAGMDAYISKPIDFKQCLQVIEDVIRQTATP
jgi:CheY-like chemotaxis protein